MLGQLGQRLGLHGVQKPAGVDLPVEAAPDRVAPGGQIQRRRHRRHRIGHAGCASAHLAGPAHQRVAAQRNAHRQQRAAAVRGV